MDLPRTLETLGFVILHRIQPVKVPDRRSTRSTGPLKRGNRRSSLPVGATANSPRSCAGRSRHGLPSSERSGAVRPAGTRAGEGPRPTPLPDRPLVVHQRHLNVRISVGPYAPAAVAPSSLSGTRTSHCAPAPVLSGLRSPFGHKTPSMRFREWLEDEIVVCIFPRGGERDKNGSSKTL